MKQYTIFTKGVIIENQSLDQVNVYINEFIDDKQSKMIYNLLVKNDVVAFLTSDIEKVLIKIEKGGK